MNPRFFRSIIKRPICTRYRSGNDGDGGGDGGGSVLGGIDDRRKVQQQQHRGVVDDGGSRSLFSFQLPGGYSIGRRKCCKQLHIHGLCTYQTLSFTWLIGPSLQPCLSI
ncbi:hypothetical protein MKW92_042372 [Papaver armeniacum]|nr:hypothetical protein MKW92_042372 [Papaver armeniacum]